MKKISTLLSSVFIAQLMVAQCVMTGSATAGPCVSTTNTYSVFGFVGYVNPPTTGTLLITSSCGGTPVILMPPFSGSSSFSIPGLPANGANCTVMFSFSDLPTCIYTAMYTAPAACGATGVAENTFLTNLSIAPNPSTGSFNLTFDQTQVQTISIEVVDVLGRVVLSQTLPKFSGIYDKKLDLTTYNKGVYFVRITGEKNTEIRKIIYY